jgi:hypothetical protein
MGFIKSIHSFSCGEVHAFGDAQVHEGQKVGDGEQAVDLVSSPSGGGYWIATRNGGVRCYGDAVYVGDGVGEMGDGGREVVGMKCNSKGDGYWLFCNDGTTLNFGSAGFHGCVKIRQGEAAEGGDELLEIGECCCK